MEIEELRRQRDLAKSQADELRQKLEGEQQVSLSVSLALSPVQFYAGLHHLMIYTPISGFKAMRITQSSSEEVPLFFWDIVTKT